MYKKCINKLWSKSVVIINVHNFNRGQQSSLNTCNKELNQLHFILQNVKN